MPFVSVRCPNCGGDIHLDDAKESGFCVYCGAKIVYREAVQKMELSGEIVVQGIAGLERLLQNSETFMKLKEYKKAADILLTITDQYPEDYRAWWQLSQFAITCPYRPYKIRCWDYYSKPRLTINWEGVFEFCFNYDGNSWSTFLNRENGHEYKPSKLIQNALFLAPQTHVNGMKNQVKT